MAKEKREPVKWVTLKGGRRIPIYDGDTRDDIKNRIAESVKQGPKNAKVNTTASNASKMTGNSLDAHKKDKDIAKSESVAEKLNNESKYRDELAKGDKVSLNSGKMSFKGKPVPDISTKEAGIQGPDSFTAHLKNGKLTPERAEVHRQIIEDYFKGHKPYAPGEEKVAMFTGGGGASGKGVFTKKDEATGKSNIGDFYSQNKNPLTIDPDDIKKLLAKADGTEINGKNTGFYHEESSALAKQIYATALQHQYPALYDGTATGSGVYELLKMSKDAGYKTEMNFLYSDWKTVRQNSLDRYVKQHRLVPIREVMKAHIKAYDAVQKLSQTDLVDSIKVYDNAGRNLKLTAEGGKGKGLSIKDAASMKRFSDSAGEFTLNEKQIEEYARDVAKLKKKYNIPDED